MENAFRPFAASATDWRADVFFRARVKLTALYMAVMLAVIMLFSVTLYISITHDIKEAARPAIREGIDLDRFLEEQNSNIIDVLLLLDVPVLFLACALSYAFAGYTLKPITSIMRAQERFAADAAHEFRTPLAIIQTQIEVLLRGQEQISEKTKGTLVSVLDETKNLTDITKDLLLAARAEAGLRQQALEAVSLPEFVTEVVRDLQPVAAAKTVSVMTEKIPRISVFADKNGLRRIFINVIDNAVKYTPEGGHVAISFAGDGQRMVRVIVRDDGQGISKENLPHVFERFYKADNARQSAGGGLGLAIVKELVESYGGSVAMKSDLGSGTTVTLRLKKADA
jgi:signal transduction histidine kinase